MSIIKSAYELAMERANSIKIDPKDLQEKELEKTGKVHASLFLNDPKFNFNDYFQNIPIESKPSILKGILWTIKANIKLPMNTLDVDKALKLKELCLLISDKTQVIEEVFAQIIEVFQKYIESSTQLLEQCKDQFAPRLAQKAQEIARKTGRQVQIDPETDREFIDFQRRNQEQLDNHFKEYLDQLKNALEDII